MIYIIHEMAFLQELSPEDLGGPPLRTYLPLICGRDLEGVALPRLLLLHAADGARRHHQPRHRLHLRLEPQHARLGRRRRERRHDIHALKEKGEEGVWRMDGRNFPRRK